MNKRIEKNIYTALFLIGMAIVGCSLGKCSAFYGGGKVYQKESREGAEKGIGEKGIGGEEIKTGIRIVIDPGHGGMDPGKIGISGSEEKNINLEISKKIKKYLELMGVNVIMTREEDADLSQGQAKNKKRADMNNRLKLINESDAEMIISIHQNSFTDQKVFGAQCFYYSKSNGGREAAGLIQESINERADVFSKRQVKADNTYFLLKNSNSTMVIVECGFLSNGEEEGRLVSESYQDRMAYAIAIGAIKACNNN